MNFSLDRDRTTRQGTRKALRTLGKTSFLAFSLTALLLLPAASALAAPPTLNWGTEVNAGQCDTTGSPIVDVTHKVVNSIDSGLGGYWAYEDYNKQIQVWAQGDGVYCAVVGYLGHFTGAKGQQSPGNTEALTGDEDGTFQGGYRAIIEGEPLVEPTWPTRGRAGTIDYECDIVTVDCPGAVSWVDQYFHSGYSFAYDWWGWIYHGGRHGTWVNSSAGNAGDIT